MCRFVQLMYGHIPLYGSIVHSTYNVQFIFSQVLAMLRYLSTGSDFASTGDAQLKHCKTTVHDCVWEGVDFLYYNHERYIRWPQTEPEMEELAQLFDVNRYQNKPYCIGCVDCTHIGCKKPNYHWQEEAFVNRKAYHSINTMVS